MLKNKVRKQSNHITFGSDGSILIRCLLREDFVGGLEFYCPYCNMMHRHGVGEGTRQSHCNNSILKNKEYRIVLDFGEREKFDSLYYDY